MSIGVAFPGQTVFLTLTIYQLGVTFVLSTIAERVVCQYNGLGPG